MPHACGWSPSQRRRSASNFGTGSAWPDLLVAAAMATLALTGTWAVVRQARHELRTASAAAG